MISLQSSNRITGQVTVPVWGEVSIRALTLNEVRRIEKAQADPMQAFLLSVGLSVSKEDGTRMFADTDIPRLADISFEILEPIANAVVDQMATRAKIDEAKKNLMTTN